MNAIRLYGENFINADCGYTFLSGSTLESYLYDQKPASQWSSSGSDDTTEETIEIVFKNWQGAEVTRTIDTLILLNHNIKSGGADSWSGTAWVEIASAAISDNDEDNLIIDLSASVSTSRIRFRLNTTMVENAEKVIGEVKACLNIFDGSQLWLSSFARSDVQQAGSYNLAGGSLVQWREYARLNGALDLYDVSKTNRDTLFPYFTANGWLTIALYYDHDPSAVYEVAIVSAPNEMIDRKTELYSLSMEVKER